MFLLILMLALGGLAMSEDHAVDAITSAQTYRIQPTDVLDIFVWKEPQLSRKVFVRPDGFISVPLLQDVKVAGLTPAELKEQVENGLKEYIASPNVTIILDSIQNYTVYVIGRVHKPGSFSSDRPICILQALSLAGGFEEYAKKSKILVVRSRRSQHEIIPFNYDEIAAGKTPGEHIILQPDDVVVVP